MLYSLILHLLALIFVSMLRLTSSFRFLTPVSFTSKSKYVMFRAQAVSLSSSVGSSYLHSHPVQSHSHSREEKKKVASKLPLDEQLFSSLVAKKVLSYYNEGSKSGPQCASPSSLLLMLCVSGGSDSMAMWHMFESIKRTRNLSNLYLEVIHFNHKQRAESDEEEKLVRETAAHYCTPCHVFEYPEKDAVFEASVKNLGFQASARAWRRSHAEDALAVSAARLSIDVMSTSASLFDEIGARDIPDHEFVVATNPITTATPPTSSKSTKGGMGRAFIVTGHHIEDQMETMLLKFVRGVHLSNFKEMQTVSAGKYLKPLLEFSKQDLRQYLVDRGLRWMDDLSNNDVGHYKRNRVRLELIPLLAELAGGATALRDRLHIFSSQSMQVKELIDREIDKVLDGQVHSSSSTTVVGSNGKSYSDGDGESQARVMSVTPELISASELIVAQIINSWVHKEIGKTLSHKVTMHITSVLVRNFPDASRGISAKSVNIGGSWVVERIGKELRLRRVAKLPVFTAPTIMFNGNCRQQQKQQQQQQPQRYVSSEYVIVPQLENTAPRPVTILVHHSQSINLQVCEFMQTTSTGNFHGEGAAAAAAAIGINDANELMNTINLHNVPVATVSHHQLPQKKKKYANENENTNEWLLRRWKHGDRIQCQSRTDKVSRNSSNNNSSSRRRSSTALRKVSSLLQDRKVPVEIRSETLVLVKVVTSGYTNSNSASNSTSNTPVGGDRKKSDNSTNALASIRSLVEEEIACVILPSGSGKGKSGKRVVASSNSNIDSDIDICNPANNSKKNSSSERGGNSGSELIQQVVQEEESLVGSIITSPKYAKNRLKSDCCSVTFILSTKKGVPCEGTKTRNEQPEVQELQPR